MPHICFHKAQTFWNDFFCQFPGNFCDYCLFLGQKSLFLTGRLLRVESWSVNKLWRIYEQWYCSHEINFQLWRSSAIRRSCISSGRFISKSCYYLEILLVHKLLINCSYYFLYPGHAIIPYTTENTSVGGFTEIIQTGWERKTTSCTHPTNHNAENNIHEKV